MKIPKQFVKFSLRVFKVWWNASTAILHMCFNGTNFAHYIKLILVPLFVEITEEERM